MTIPSFYLEKVGEPFIFDCKYDINLLNLNTAPAFYIDVLKSWAHPQGNNNNNTYIAPISILLFSSALKNKNI